MVARSNEQLTEKEPDMNTTVDTTIAKIEALINQYRDQARIAETRTRRGVTTLVIGVNTAYHKALIADLEALEFCRKGDEYALQTSFSSVIVPGMDEVIIVRLAA